MIIWKKIIICKINNLRLVETESRGKHFDKLFMFTQ